MAFISFSFSALPTRSHRPSRLFQTIHVCAAASASPSWTTSRVRRPTSRPISFQPCRHSSNSLRNRVSSRALVVACDRSPIYRAQTVMPPLPRCLAKPSPRRRVYVSRVRILLHLAARRVASAAACPSAACTASRRFNSFNSSIVSSSFARRFLARVRLDGLLMHQRRQRRRSLRRRRRTFPLSVALLLQSRHRLAKLFARVRIILHAIDDGSRRVFLGVDEFSTPSLIATARLRHRQQDLLNCPRSRRRVATARPPPPTNASPADASTSRSLFQLFVRRREHGVQRRRDGGRRALSAVASVFGSSNATCAVSTLTFMFIVCNASHASSRAASTRASSRVNASTRARPLRTRPPRRGASSTP